MTHCSGDPKVAEIVTGAFKKQWEAEEAKVWKNIYLLKKIDWYETRKQYYQQNASNNL